MASQGNSVATSGGVAKEMGMKKLLFEKWDKAAASGELQKNPDLLTKLHLGMEWVDLHPEFGIQVAQYRLQLQREEAIREGKEFVADKSIQPWKPDPSIVSMWNRWAEEQEEEKRDQQRALEQHKQSIPSAIDSLNPNRQPESEAIVLQRCQSQLQK